MIENLLKELGLSSYEIKIYLALLKMGETTAGKIAQGARVNRRNVYDALDRLSRRGFVGLVHKNGKTIYLPASPEKLVASYREKLDLAQSLIPEISKINTKSSREVHVFEGNEGMKTFFNQLFLEQKPIYVIGATGLSIERIPFFMSQLFLKKLKKVKIKQLWNPQAKNLQKYHDLLNSEDRLLPKNLKTSTQIFLCGDLSVILIWSEVPLAIMIKDKEIEAGFKKYFDFLWALSK